MKSKLLRRGIEPIIAVVILVAVTLVIAIGVIGWIMGWWGTFGATENLQPYPDSYIQCTPSGNSTRCILYLHLKNVGSASAVIYKIEISGVDTLSGAQADSGLTATLKGTVFVSTVPISPGLEDTLTIPLHQTSYTPGTNYLVKIYTRAGNVYSVTVQAK